MGKYLIASAALCSLFLATAVLPAHADLKITQTTVIDAPGMKSMLSEIPPDKRAPLLGMLSGMVTGTPWVTTTWLQGSRLRTDMGETTVVVNADSGKEFTLNNITKVYSIGPYDPFQKAAGVFDCKIVPTGQTSTLLGHPIARYTISMTMSVLPKSPIVGEIWSATDLPTPPAPVYAAGPAADFAAQMAKVQGMPLAFKLVYPNTPAGTITVESYATSIDAGPLPLSAFRIPGGYTQGATRSATKMPSAGYPLGDGMPLDSTDPVTDAMATGQDDGPGQEMSGQGADMQQLQGMIAGMLGAGSATSSDAASAGAGGSAALGGMSPQALSSLLGALSSETGAGNASSGSGDLGSMISPQMLQQLSAQLSSLLSSDDGQ